MRTVHLVTPLDRERADACIVSAVGPMKIPPVADVRRALVEFGAIGPHTRVGLLPSARSLWWPYRPAELADRVEVIDPVELGDLDRVMSCMAQQYRGEGIRLYLAGDFLLMRVSHGLCDARLLMFIQNVLMSSMDPKGVVPQHTRAVLVSTALKWFLAKPRRLVRLARLDRKRAAVAVQWLPVTDRPAPEPTLRWISIPPDTRAAVLAAMTLRAPGATEATAWFSLIATALGRHGIEIAPSVVVLADGRRYGAAAARFLGNFAVGLEFDFPAPFDPARLSGQIQSALRAGRPLAAMGVAALTALSGTRRKAAQICVPQRPIVSFSDIGRAVREQDLPWRNDFDRAYVATTEGIGYNGISFILVEIGGAVLVQCSFNAAAHQPAAIEAVLSSLCDCSVDMFVGSGQ